MNPGQVPVAKHFFCGTACVRHCRMMLPLLLLAVAADPVAIAPTSKWQVEYAASMCVLSRDYGSGADKVALGLRPMPMSDQSEIVLLTQGRGAETVNDAVTIRLLPAGQPTTGSYTRFTMSKDGGRLATMYLSGDALAGLDKAAGIEVRLGAESHVLATPGIAGAMAALSICQDDLLKGWGVDPAERALEATHVQGNPARFFGPSEYPREAIRAQAQGRVVTIEAVDANGAVADCWVVVSSGSKVLDDKTCAIARRSMHFSPARDKDGNAVPSHYILPVRWVLPTS
jgi:TonB family protein